MRYWLRICNKNIRLHRCHKHLSSFNFHMIKTSNHLLNTVSDTVLGALKYCMYIYIYIYFFFFWFHHTAWGILVPWPGIEPRPPGVEVQSPNHWIAKQFCWEISTYMKWVILYLNFSSKKIRITKWNFCSLVNLMNHMPFQVIVYTFRKIVFFGSCINDRQLNTQILKLCIYWFFFLPYFRIPWLPLAFRFS